MINTVATEIARQIGPKAFAMMGTANEIWADGPALIFDIKGSKWKKVKVTLNAMDTYDVAFFKMNRKTCVVTRHDVNDVYVEQLHEVIERETGLYLNL